MGSDKENPENRKIYNDISLIGNKKNAARNSSYKLIYSTPEKIVKSKTQGFSVSWRQNYKTILFWKGTINYLLFYICLYIYLCMFNLITQIYLKLLFERDETIQCEKYYWETQSLICPNQIFHKNGPVFIFFLFCFVLFLLSDNRGKNVW